MIRGFFQNEDVRKQAISTGLCLFFFVLAVVTQSLSPELSVLLFGAAFLSGMWYPVLETAEEIVAAKIDVDFLMVLVALGAWLLDHPGEGALLLVLFGTSRAMEAYARGRTRTSISDLVEQLPSRATRLRNGEREEIDVDAIAVGDELLIRPGDKFPVDSALVQGKTVLDLSAITGEAEPVEPQPGFEIPSGAVNGNGLVHVRAIKTPQESAYQKIIALIENAPQRRSPAQVLSDQVGSIFTVVILSVSIAAFFLWWLAMGMDVRDAAYRSMVLLVAGSPCAIVLSIPSAILAAISSGARRGILFNGGLGLSALGHVRRIAFDKTGTLSTGEPGVKHIFGEGAERKEELAAAYALAHSSTHPASRSVVRYLEEHGFANNGHQLENVEERPGSAIVGTWNGKRIELGRARGCHLFIDNVDSDFSRVFFYCDGEPRIRFYLRETPRKMAAEAIAALKARKFSLFIISGDIQSAVDRMAGVIGIDDARGELGPDDKHAIIAKEAHAPGGVAMVGDGVNDAPALAEATVGIAMGVRGSAATLAQADIILVKDRLMDLVEATDLSRRTRRIIFQNLTIAIGAAALLVTGAIAGSLPLALGVFGHEGGTVLVVLNSLRLLLGNAGPPVPRKPTEAPVNAAATG